MNNASEFIKKSLYLCREDTKTTHNYERFTKEYC